MEIKTFDTILNEMCDTFDALISPKVITRSNTNVIYLMFKAISKGFEVINNVCVSLSSKFDPANCSTEDLVSVASLVGTEKLSGSATGLEILVKNEGSEAQNLLAGDYYYHFDDDTTFMFEVPNTVLIEAGDTEGFFAFSENLGSYPVTAQTDISIEPEEGLVMSTSFAFSCNDNEALLGTDDETDVEFRKRILTDTTRQDSLVELQTTLRNLPYLYDCTLYFNNTTDTETLDGISVPSYHMAIFYSGAPRKEIAEIVASKSIFPTVSTTDSTPLEYSNSVFVGEKYTVHVIPFKKTEYKVDIKYRYNPTYIAPSVAEAQIKSTLFANFRSHIHSDYVTEADIFNVLNNMGMANITFLNVDFKDTSDNPLDYITVPVSRLPYLADADFVKVAING